MIEIIVDLVLVGILLLAVAVFALAPVGFMGVMFWRWHRELSRLREGRAVRMTPVPVRRPAHASVLALAAHRANKLERRAS